MTSTVPQNLLRGMIPVLKHAPIHPKDCYFGMRFSDRPVATSDPCHPCSPVPPCRGVPWNLPWTCPGLPWIGGKVWFYSRQRIAKPLLAHPPWSRLGFQRVYLQSSQGISLCIIPKSRRITLKLRTNCHQPCPNSWATRTNCAYGFGQSPIASCLFSQLLIFNDQYRLRPEA